MDENTNVSNKELEVNDNKEAQQEFTEAQMAMISKMIQSETDKVRTKYSNQMKELKRQQSLSGLDEAERNKKELEMLRNELAERDKQDAINVSRNEVIKTLSSRGLDTRFADILLISDDVEASQQVISTFDKLFKLAVKAEVEKKFENSGKPKVGTTGLDGAVTKEQFKKMTLSQKHEIKLNNPELYNTLVKR